MGNLILEQAPSRNLPSSGDRSPMLGAGFLVGLVTLWGTHSEMAVPERLAPVEV